MNAKKNLIIAGGVLVILVAASISAGITRSIYERKLAEYRAAELDARVAYARHTAELERNLAAAKEYSRRLRDGIARATAIIQRGADRPATLRLLADQLDAIAAAIENGVRAGDSGDQGGIRATDTKP